MHVVLKADAMKEFIYIYIWNMEPYVDNWPILMRCPKMIDLFMETLRRKQNGRNFVNDILKCISVNGKGKVLHLIKISPKFVPEGPSNIKSSLF